MPDRAPTGRPAPWRFDPAACASDLDAFARLLAVKAGLAEKADILPFFRDHPHLAAFLGTYAYTANTVDRLAVEVYDNLLRDLRGHLEDFQTYATKLP